MPSVAFATLLPLPFLSRPPISQTCQKPVQMKVYTPQKPLSPKVPPDKRHSSSSESKASPSQSSPSSSPSYFARAAIDSELVRWLRRRERAVYFDRMREELLIRGRIVDVRQDSRIYKKFFEKGKENNHQNHIRKKGKVSVGRRNSFIVRSGLRYMYQPPPPYCAVGGNLSDYIHALDGRVWYLGVAGRNKVVRALEIVSDFHNQDIITENVMTAAIVADLQMDCETVCAAVLKDCMGGVMGVDEEVVGGEVGWDVVSILKLNGKVAGVVDMVRKGEIGVRTDSDIDVDEFEALRELMVAVADDPRAISLQLASAVVAMRSLGKLKDAESERMMAKKALQLYAPLAHQLGIWFIQSELEELAFMYLHPVEYDEIRKLVGVRLKESRNRLQEYKEQLERAICSSSAVVNNARCIRVKGRVKGIYSTYRKMKRTHKQIDEIYDLLALRVIVQPRSDDEQVGHRVCYDILGAVKAHFDIIDGREKDYIANPKSNGYKSLHATICPGSGAPPIEIQVRTEKMHHVAEFGAAAHWIYQEDRKKAIDSYGKENDTNDSDNERNGGGDGIEEQLLELSIPKEDEIGLRGGRLSGNDDLEIVHSIRQGYLRYLSAAIRASWVIVHSCGKLYKMAVGSTLMDLATGMGLASFNAIALVNGTTAPLTQRLEMNDFVHFIQGIS